LKISEIQLAIRGRGFKFRLVHHLWTTLVISSPPLFGIGLFYIFDSVEKHFF